MIRITVAMALSVLPHSTWGQVFGLPASTTAACSIEIKPAKVLILGGVSSSGLKPADVGTQLDRQMEAFERTVHTSHGTLVQLERTRAIITNRPAREENSPTFEMVQRVRAEFNADAPVDSILNQLLLIGLDRFGDSLQSNSGRQTSMPVRYAFRDFSGDMRAFRDQCHAQAEKQFCEEYADQCSSGPPKNTSGSFFARSDERVLRPEGGSNYLDWNEPVAGRVAPQLNDPQLLGNIAVHMKGSYTLSPLVMAR